MPWNHPGLQALEEDRFKKLELLLQTQRDELVAMEKLRHSKLEKEKREAEAELQMIRDERKAAELVANAAARAKEDAEAEADKRTRILIAEHEVEMEKQKAAADKYKKEAEANKKDDDSKKAPIKFKDGVGRKFIFPYKICKTWQVSCSHVDRSYAWSD